MKTRPLIIAHRGESNDAPENTLAAINLAWQRKADAVEVDVHLTVDNQIVVIHDSNTKRTGNQAKEIKTSTLEELKRITVGNAKYPYERIPILGEVFATVPVGKKILVEIKTGDEIIPKLIQEVNNSNLEEDQIEFIGFDFQTMTNIKKAFPSHRTHWILELGNFWLNRIFNSSIEKIILKAKENNIDGLDLRAGKMINAKLIRKVKSVNMIVYLWTVNDPMMARSYFQMGVDGITTDRAGWMREKLELSNI